MGRPNLLRTVAVALAIVVLALASGFYPPAGGPSSLGRGSTTVAGLTYTWEPVQIPLPSPSAGWPSSSSNFTYDGVVFALWLVEWNVSAGGILEGTGSEPGGIKIGFAIRVNATAVPTSSWWKSPEGLNWWTAPDRTFGVQWAGPSGSEGLAVLMVVQPWIRYAEENVSIPLPSSPGPSPPSTYAFHCVVFRLSIQGWPSPGGPSLLVVGTESNGTSYTLGLWDGPLVACSVIGSDSGRGAQLWGGANCLEGGSPDHRFGVIWAGYTGDGTTLVRLLADPPSGAGGGIRTGFSAYTELPGPSVVL